MAEEQTAVISGNEAVSSISEGTADENEKAKAEDNSRSKVFPDSWWRFQCV